MEGFLSNSMKLSLFIYCASAIGITITLIGVIRDVREFVRAGTYKFYMLLTLTTYLIELILIILSFTFNLNSYYFDLTLLLLILITLFWLLQYLFPLILYQFERPSHDD